MKIPRTIKIGAHQIKIKVVKNIDEPVLGYADLNHNLIYLRTEYSGKPLTESMRAEVLLHEIIHQISELHGIGLSEKEVRQLGAELLSTIRDNKLNFLDKRSK